MMVITVVQTVFIPSWMKEIEADHMDQVADQFGQLKFAVDLQSTLKTKDLPITVPITIGNKGFPILQSLRSYGDLNIINNIINITIENNSVGIIYGENLGGIMYSSTNSYFLDQSYIYEAGSIVLSQDEGNIMTVQPSFSMNRIGSNLDVNITFSNIIKVGNKDSVSGYGTYPIRLKFKTNSSINIPNDVTDITITTSYKESWSLYIKSLLKNLLFSDADIDNAIDDSGPNQVIIDFTSNGFNGLNINYNVNKIDIYAQIAPGWIEE
jgi:hypothetical protein